MDPVGETGEVSRVRARSGTPVDQITLDGVLAGEVSLDDIRIHPDTLLAQAEVATRAGNAQLGENFRRAAELTALTDERVLAIYEALRPHRSSAADLDLIAAELDDLGATRNASLVREAARVYAARGLLR
ncbi:MAG: diol dehydratase small subunit [Kineosporiaceae bacterium]|nr:diol dehydratase small subunit [Kineosporiaceae bacterium]